MDAKMVGALEAILYVSGEPQAIEALRMALTATPLEMQAAIEALEERYHAPEAGLKLLRFGQSLQLSTNPSFTPEIERFLSPVKRQTLSQAVLETLAVIAYRQPATRSDVEAVRGVKCDYSVQSLLLKGMICEVGRRDTLGRPVLFATTDLFLRHFGLTTLDDLPSVDWQSFPLPEASAAAETETLPL